MDLEEIYQTGYSSTINALEKKACRPESGIEEIRNELSSLYNYEGLGWAGRGMVKEAEISAAIAAYEAFLCSYKDRENS